jgi:Mce-associated membrane protein
VLDRPTDLEPDTDLEADTAEADTDVERDAQLARGTDLVETDDASAHATVAADAIADPDANADPADRRTRRGSLWASAIGAAVALALLVTALVYGLRPTVSDGDRTAAVSSARTTLESLLSYSGSTFDKHVGEVSPQLTAPFKDQFTKVAASDIKPMAVKNEATVQAKVYEAGVMDTTGDGGEGTTVRVMAFVNQATTTKAQQAPAIDQNRVIATMRKVGDRWLVSELSAF